MIRLFLLRHGESEWNAAGNRYCGRTDIDLSERGADQARTTGAFLRDVAFDAGIASPFQRTQQTLAIVAPGQTPIIAPEMTEIDFGSWEGMTPGEIAASEPHEWHIYRTDPAAIRPGNTGESLAEVGIRAELFLKRLRDNYDGETVLAVGHNTFNRVLIADSLGINRAHFRRIHQTNAAVSVATIDNQHVEWLSINCTPAILAPFRDA